MVRVLVEGGSDVHEKNANGDCPLNEAILDKHFDVANLCRVVSSEQRSRGATTQEMRATVAQQVLSRMSNAEFTAMEPDPVDNKR
eukprot:JP448072.1.p2 GENE.JP448072.1~~JP448072.1.p2  ORF type:complete len:85 (+),score=19.19 JP448072.1:125-379(+)